LIFSIVFFLALATLPTLPHVELICNGHRARFLFCTFTRSSLNLKQFRFNISNRIVKGNAPQTIVKAVKAKSKVIKAGVLTNELMNKAVCHIASEIVAAKSGLDNRTPRGFAEKLVREGKEIFPKLTMNKVNYAVKLLKLELKKGSLSLNADSNISSLTDEAAEKVISTASPSNVTSGSKSSLESNANNPKRKRGMTDNNTSNPRSMINTSAVNNGSEKKTKKSPISSKNTVPTQMQLADQKAPLMLLLESFLKVSSKQQAKQCVS
jgi:hypothetical protein